MLYNGIAFGIAAIAALWLLFPLTEKVRKNRQPLSQLGVLGLGVQLLRRPNRQLIGRLVAPRSYYYFK